jgi:superfamily I DNA/RNA helicase
MQEQRRALARFSRGGLVCFYGLPASDAWAPPRGGWCAPDQTRLHALTRHHRSTGHPLHAEATAWVAAHGEVDLAEEPVEKTAGVAVTSFQGSKGRSAQYVFIVGLHSGEMPRNETAIDDFEICCFLVGLTRTKKKCDVLFARNANGRWKNPSEFLTWIRPERFQTVQVNSAYFA